ncbi:YceI family protein [Bdellovibrio bacteriovorus]|uniref:YCE I like family protein n=1 Tax=Bdellovibrio bacteriovorus TaxID=959 RepID=A0A150WEB0_BDEBC|nr:YceI family protein [Bdellovibrio bacteriovorus]KYG61212.1 YCE I like family protein [Bdellovibrio bacteriovorus]
MMKLVLSALLVLSAVSAQAADVYKIDTKASTVAWKGTKKVGSAHDGAIAVKEGDVTVDKGQLKSANIVIDMATITNNDVKDAEYNKKLVGHLSNDDFFNVPKFPTSTFKLTKVTPKSKEEVTVKGELTIKGVTQPIEFPAKVVVGKDTVTGTAVVKVDRTKWGIKYGSGNFFKELAGDKIISDEFELNLNLVAKK